jgi:hypothetical protein
VRARLGRRGGGDESEGAVSGQVALAEAWQQSHVRELKLLAKLSRRMCGLTPRIYGRHGSEMAAGVR